MRRSTVLADVLTKKSEGGMSQDMVAEKVELLPPGSQDAWQKVKARIRAQAGEDHFEMYFLSLKLEEIAGNIMVVSTVNSFNQKQILEKYLDLIMERCQAVWPQVLQLRVVIRKVGCAYVPLEEAASPYVEGDLPDPAQTQDEALPAESAEELEEAPVIILPVIKRKRVYIKEILKFICFYFRLRKNELLSERQNYEVLWPRQIAMYLAKKLTGRPLPEIGRKFGGRDHTTVLHSVRKIEELMRENALLARDIEMFSHYLKHENVKRPEPPSSEVALLLAPSEPIPYKKVPYSNGTSRGL